MRRNLLIFALASIMPLACLAQGSNVSGTGAGSAAINPANGANLLQAYTLSATGTQPAISLTANPIDTHTISWRLSPGTTSTVTDAFAYANGSLSGSNPNWVNQVGTFTISANVAYGSAAASFITRSDGPSAATNAVAQETLVETGALATQNHGPCVDMQASAQTAYCIRLANNMLRVTLWNAGAATDLSNFDYTAPVTGDVVKLVVVRTTTNTLTMYKNGIQLGPAVIDNTITTGGFVGMYSNGNATVNGASNFTGGALANCTIELDSSVDGSTWVPGGAIGGSSGLSCANPNQSSVVQGLIANNVRVNVTALSAGQTLSVVYSGRLAPSGNAGNTASVSNGQWVNAGEVLWVQDTLRSDLPPGGTFGINAAFRIQQVNGQTYENTWNVNCTISTTIAAHAGGTGFTLPVSGWLTGFNTQITGNGFPQGYMYTNLYVLTSMPAGGGTSTCTDGLLTVGNITGGLLLAAMPTGSNYPVAFTGTTLVPASPWQIPGFTTTVTQSTPAAGAEWTYTVPAIGRTCVQSVSFTAVAGSTGINPVLVFTLNSAKLVYAPGTQQGAGTTQTYSFSPGASAETVTAGSTLFHIVPFNNGQMVCFNAGLTTATIGTVTTTINGTTQYSAINIVVQVQQDNN